ncbi:MAG: kelch repeat-containing protein [Brevinematales bacterium]|jgi:hypothetical protein
MKIIMPLFLFTIIISCSSLLSLNDKLPGNSGSPSGTGDQYPDGSYWVCAVTNAAFPARYGHTSLVFNNMIWVIGGYTSSGVTNDVWYSADGTFWECATNSNPFVAKLKQSCVVFNNYM